MNRELKFIASLNRPMSRNFGEVAYVITGDRCIFSGLTTALETNNSTINLAEHIIVAIAQSESVDPQTLTIFDLQTHLGYGASGKKLGQFEYDHLHFKVKDGVPRVTWWEPVVCPREVMEIFAEQIGPNPIQLRAPKD